MWGSAILEVAVGILFLFLLVSTMCTAVREVLEALLKTRAAYLEHGIRELLQDQQGSGLAAELYKHPLIYSLYLGEYKQGQKSSAALFANGRGRPSYIPSRSFAMALLDIAARGPNFDPNGPTPAAPTVQSIRASLAKLENPAVRRALALALEAANDDLSRARVHVEAWFDSAMDRVSGWYKRSTHWINLATALVITLALNIDTFAIAQFLYRSDTARNAIVAQAERSVENGVEADSAAIKAELDTLELPIGWSGLFEKEKSEDARVPTGFASAADVVKHLLGLLVTVLAATLGAPFWFDVLNKVMVIRSTVKPHEKSPEEGSEDRQPSAPQPRVVYLSGGGASNSQDEHFDPSEADACGMALDGDETLDEELPVATGGVT